MFPRRQSLFSPDTPVSRFNSYAIIVMTNCGDRALNSCAQPASFASWIQVLIASRCAKNRNQSQISRCSCPGRDFWPAGHNPLRVELFDVELPCSALWATLARNAESAGPRLIHQSVQKWDHLRCGGRAHPTGLRAEYQWDILFAFTISMANNRVSPWWLPC